MESKGIVQSTTASWWRRSSGHDVGAAHGACWRSSHRAEESMRISYETSAVTA